MSTILKALNKAESKPAIVRQRIGVEESFQQEDLRSSGNFWKKRGGSYFLVALILCVVVAGVWRYMGSSSGSFEKRKIKTYRITRESSEGAMPASSPSRITNRQSDTQAPAVKDRTKTKPVHPPVGEGKPRQSSTAALPRQEPKARTGLPQRSAKQARQPNIPTKRHSPQESTNIPAPTKNKTERIELAPGKSDAPASADAQPWRDAPPLANTKMRLQALAWAHQPEKRMVVIDGQVVREGDDVNGYTVARIRESDIILQQNKRYFRLAFNR